MVICSISMYHLRCLSAHRLCVWQTGNWGMSLQYILSWPPVNSLLCRMRIGQSYFKSHGFAINLSSSERCMCGAVDENKHLLLFCFIFQEERQTMLSKINLIIPNFLSFTISKQVFILLNGINLDS